MFKVRKIYYLEVPSQMVSEVADVVARPARIVVKVEWIDKTLGEIAAKREHINMFQEACNLKKKIEQLDRERGEAV